MNVRVEEGRRRRSRREDGRLSGPSHTYCNKGDRRNGEFLEGWQNDECEKRKKK